MYDGDCDAAIAKAAATVTHVYRARVRRLVLGMRYFFFFFPIISRNGLLVAGGRVVETLPVIFVFRMTSYVHRRSGQTCVSSMYPRRRWLPLSSQAKAFTLQGRHRRFIGDSSFIRRPVALLSLLATQQQKKWYHHLQ